MNRAEELAAKAQRLAAATRSKDQLHEKKHRPAVKAPRAVRTAPVRLSTDLAPVDHAELIRFCADTAQQLGASRIPGQVVVRALISRLLKDRTLAEEIRQEIAQHLDD